MTKENIKMLQSSNLSIVDSTYQMRKRKPQNIDRQTKPTPETIVCGRQNIVKNYYFVTSKKEENGKEIRPLKKWKSSLCHQLFVRHKKNYSAYLST